MNQQQQISLSGCVFQVRFSPDGSLVAVAGGDKDPWIDGGFVHLYSTETCALLQVREHPFRVSCLAWSPDGRRLAYGGKEGTVWVWDWQADQFRSYLEHSPELAYLPAVSEPKRREVFAVAWVTNEQVTSVGSDGSVRIFQAETGETVHATYYEQVSPRWSFAPDGLHAAMSLEQMGRAATTLIYDLEARCALLCLLHTQEEGAPSLVWAPMGELRFITGHWEQLHLWDLQTGTVRATLPTDLYAASSFDAAIPFHAVVCSPDASRLACVVRWSERHHILVEQRRWSTTVVEVRSLTMGEVECAYVVTAPTCLDWSPRGDLLAVGERGGWELLPFSPGAPAACSVQGE